MTEYGTSVVIAGPDGTGKSAIVSELSGLLSGEVLLIHHRPSVLPRRSQHEGPVTRPHEKAPYSRPLSIAKVLYLWLDFLIGWFVHVRPAVRRGATVLIERGWWDLAVDPARYRLNAPASIIAFLGDLLPGASRTVILTGDVEVILARKAELPREELRRQLDAWRKLCTRMPDATLVGVDADLESVAARAYAAAFL